MPPVRIEFTVRQETFDRIEAARGDVPRAAWIKRALDRDLGRQRLRPGARVLESALDAGGGGNTSETPSDGMRSPASTRAPVSSSRAKAGVKAIPKGAR